MIREDELFDHDRPYPQGWALRKKKVKMLFSDYMFKALLWVLSRRKKKQADKKYQVAICAIFKNEAPYLREWLEYHQIIGVQKFYLYNNNSDDEYIEVLRPYLAHGIVELFNWPQKCGQVAAYEDCFKRFRDEVQWIGFIDLDEFVCPRYETSIATWLSRYQMYPSVMIYWKMFGTSGLANRDLSTLVTERFINSWQRLDDVTKVFFNTQFDAYDFENFHVVSARLRVGWDLKKLGKTIIIPPINEFGKFYGYGIHRVGHSKTTDVTVQINHYWSKSYSEYRDKKVPRGDAHFEVPFRDYQYFLLHEKRNISSDYTIWRFLLQLKINLGLIKE